MTAADIVRNENRASVSARKAKRKAKADAESQARQAAAEACAKRAKADAKAEAPAAAAAEAGTAAVEPDHDEYAATLSEDEIEDDIEAAEREVQAQRRKQWQREAVLESLSHMKLQARTLPSTMPERPGETYHPPALPSSVRGRRDV